MIVRHLLRLRRAPKAVRDRYAFLVATAFTGVVALLWVAFLPGRFAPATDTSGGGANATPFASLISGARTQLAAVTSAFKGTTATTTPEGRGLVSTSTVVQSVVTATSSIILSPEEVAAATKDDVSNWSATTTRTSVGARASTTAGRVVQIVTSSSLATTTGTEATSSRPD